MNFVFETMLHTSWMATRSSSRILSNSSIHTTPPSASTIAPPSNTKSPCLSLITEAVKPAAEEPLPLVYTPTGATFSTNCDRITYSHYDNMHICGRKHTQTFRNCDFAVEGSPNNSTLISPRNRIPSGRSLRLPAISKHRIAFLMSAV